MDKKYHFGPKIKNLNNAFENALNQALASQGLTTAQSFFLARIQRITKSGEKVYPKDLASEFNLKYSTVSGILSRLEANGFITYEPDAADKRLKSICITDKAVAQHNEIVERFDALENRMLSGFTEEEAALFSSLLEKAANNIGIFCMPDLQKGEDK